MGRQTLSAAGGLVDACEVCGAEGDACCPKCGEVLCWEHLGKPCWQHQSLAVNIAEFYEKHGVLDYMQSFILKSQCEANNLDLAKIQIEAFTRADFFIHFYQHKGLLAIVAEFIGLDAGGVAVTKLLIKRQQVALYTKVRWSVHESLPYLAWKRKRGTLESRDDAKKRSKSNKKKHGCASSSTEPLENRDEFDVVSSMDADTAFRLCMKIEQLSCSDFELSELLAIIEEFPIVALKQQKLDTVCEELMQRGSLPDRRIVNNILERLKLLLEFVLVNSGM